MTQVASRDDHRARVPELLATARTGLISPEDLVEPISADEFADRVARVAPGHDLEPVFVTCNRLALELYRAGSLERAVDLCHRLLEFADRRQLEGVEPAVSALALQPMVNLIRVEGYTGEVSTAFEHLAELENLALGHEAVIFGRPVSSWFGAASPADRRWVQCFARNVVIVETAKMTLRRVPSSSWRATARRLIGMWPDTGISGPWHSHELWMVSGGQMRGGLLDVAPELGMLARTYSLASFGEPDLTQLVDLYDVRTSFARKNSLSAGRFRSVLAHLLMSVGDRRRAAVVAREAVDLVVAYDGRLAAYLAQEFLDGDVVLAAGLSEPTLLQLDSELIARLEW